MLFFLIRLSLCLQGRSSLVSLPPLMENGPHDEATFLEEEGDEDDLPSAISPSEEVEGDEDDEEPLRKKQKRQGGDSATASSPAKDATAELEEDDASSSGAKNLGDWSAPMAAPPVSSAPPLEFARMASVSLGSDDGVEVTRLVMLVLLCRVCFPTGGFSFSNFSCIFCQPSFWWHRFPSP